MYYSHNQLVQGLSKTGYNIFLFALKQLHQFTNMPFFYIINIENHSCKCNYKVITLILQLLILKKSIYENKTHQHRQLQRTSFD